MRVMIVLLCQIRREVLSLTGMPQQHRIQILTVVLRLLHQYHNHLGAFRKADWLVQRDLSIFHVPAVRHDRYLTFYVGKLRICVNCGEDWTLYFSRCTDYRQNQEIPG